jgi:hypothetical protein
MWEIEAEIISNSTKPKEEGLIKASPQAAY